MRFFYKIVISVILLILFIGCKPYNKNELTGIYINNYSKSLDKGMIPAEAPEKRDTLILYDNMRFKSICFGKGNYEI